MVDAFDNKADLQSYIITLMGVVSNATSDSFIVHFRYQLLFGLSRNALASRDFLNYGRSFFNKLSWD